MQSFKTFFSRGITISVFPRENVPGGLLNISVVRQLIKVKMEGKRIFSFYEWPKKLIKKQLFSCWIKHSIETSFFSLAWCNIHLSLPLTHTITQPHSLSNTIFYTCILRLTLILSLSLSLTLSLFHTPSLYLYCKHSHSLTHFFSDVLPAHFIFCIN